MKKYHLVNLDYESYLFDPNYHENSDQFIKINKEFEYVFFPFAKGTDNLIVHNEFATEDLDHYGKVGFQIPHMTLKKKTNFQREINYWWAKKSNKEQEIYLNSKITSSELGIKLGLGFKNGAFVKDLKELSAHLNSCANIENWILKNPFGMSGKGHYLFSSSQNVPLHIVKNRPLLEPLYKRVLDIGTTYELENGIIKNKFHVINYNDHIGQFKGAATTFNENFWRILFEDTFKIDYEKIQNQLDKVANFYLSHKPVNNIQIDSFFYLDEDNKIQFYPLVEVNCRKTMGLVVRELAKRKPDLLCEWRLSSKNNFFQNDRSVVESFSLSPKHVSHHSQVMFFKDIILCANSDWSLNFSFAT